VAGPLAAGSLEAGAPDAAGVADGADVAVPPGAGDATGEDAGEGVAVAPGAGDATGEDAGEGVAVAPGAGDAAEEDAGVPDAVPLVAAADGDDALDGVPLDPGAAPAAVPFEDGLVGEGELVLAPVGLGTGVAADDEPVPLGAEVVVGTVGLGAATAVLVPGAADDPYPFVAGVAGDVAAMLVLVLGVAVLALAAAAVLVPGAAAVLVSGAAAVLVSGAADGAYVFDAVVAGVAAGGGVLGLADEAYPLVEPLAEAALGAAVGAAATAALAVGGGTAAVPAEPLLAPT